MVAVRMVSEGVDVPRLAVGVYATTTSTPLFFAQAVGRFVRARSRGETASVFLPSVPPCSASPPRWRSSATTCSAARSPTRTTSSPPSRTCWPRRTPAEGASDELDMSFEALGSEARFDRVLFDGGEFGHAGEVHVGSEEEMDFLGIPGCSSPTRCASCSSSGRATGRRSRSRRPPASRTRSREVSTHEQLAVLRRELNGLVAAWHHRTGQPHGVTHAALRKECGGPAAAVASAEQLHARIDRIREWAARKTS